MSKRKREKQRNPSADLQKARKSFSLPLWESHPNWFTAAALTLLFLALFRFHAPLPPDTVASYSFRPFVDDCVERGVYPLWNPHIFCGMPFFASLSALYVDPVNDAVLLMTGALNWVFRFSSLVEVQRAAMMLLNHVLLGFFTFLFLRRRNLSKEASILGCLAMALMPQVIGYSNAGHSTQIASLALTPLILLLVDGLLEKRNLLFFCLTGLAAGVQLLRAHVQVCYYTWLMVGAFFLVWAVAEIRAKNAKRVPAGAGLLAGALLAGFLVSAWLNASVFEYSKYSIRGGAGGGVDYRYATAWSFSPGEMATFFIPAFMGFGGDTYWGGMPFTDFPHYFGIAVFLLAVLALALRRDRVTLFFGLFAGFALLVSFGSHFPVLYKPMFKFLPFFNKLRAPDMILLMFKFSAACLAALGAQALFDLNPDPKSGDGRKAKRALAAFGTVLAGLFLVLLLGKGAYMGWARRAGDMAGRAHDGALTDAFKALCLFGFTLGLALQVSAKKIRPGVFAFLVSAIILLDLWFVNSRIITRARADVASYFRPTSEVEFLKGQKDPFRIMTVQDRRPPNWYAYHFIQNVSGYHAAKLRAVQETLDAFGMPDDFLFKYLTQADGQYAWLDPKEVPADRVRSHHAFLKMTNVRYVLSPFSLPDSSLMLVLPPGSQGGNAVFEFKDALPRVFFPKRTVTAAGREAALGYMAGGAFDPAETAVLDAKPPADIVPSDSNRAEIVKWDIHEIEVRADIRTPSLLVFSEVYYPAGWKAFVDGRETPILRTDWMLRSVFLEPGARSVRMEFKPAVFRAGLWTTLASAGLLLLGAAFAVIRGRRKPEPGVGETAA
ncbi:MAG: hypothetical protein QUS35_11765 [bacterium]|nr:hypothetical protein [bacterium]